jgi:predicted SprT family Zn-dependent metalloprotease
MAKTTPTREAYAELQKAYDYFNRVLFERRLPACLITYTRNKRTYGYFSGDRWDGSGGRLADEIAMNPQHFESCGVADVLSTLVHEMTHLEQHHFGKPSRAGYHNKQWAGLMERVGLIPSDTGQPGGKRTGQQMTHFIEEDGAFDRACTRLLEQGFQISWIDRAREGQSSAPSSTRTKYTCTECGLNIWAKPEIRVRCEDCDQLLEEAA